MGQLAKKITDYRSPKKDHRSNPIIQSIIKD